MDPPGGSSGGAAVLPDKESRATLVSKYGARFRALAGGVSATRSQKPETEKAGPASTPQAGPPPAPLRPRSGPPPGPPAKGGPVSTLEECWNELGKKFPDEMREELSERWFKLLGEVCAGKDQAEFGPEDWGRVMGVIELPF